MGQKNKTWENTVDPDKTAPLRMGSLCHYTRKIVAMIRIIGYVVPVFKIITAVILYQIRKRIQIPLIADFSITNQICWFTQ